MTASSEVPRVCMDSPRETWPAGASHGLCVLHAIARADLGSFFTDEEESVAELKSALHSMHRDGKHIDACVELTSEFSVEWVPDLDRIAAVESADDLHEGDWCEINHDTYRRRVVEWLFESGRALEPGDARRILEDLVTEAEEAR